MSNTSLPARGLLGALFRRTESVDSTESLVSDEMQCDDLELEEHQSSEHELLMVECVACGALTVSKIVRGTQSFEFCSGECKWSMAVRRHCRC